MSYVIVAARALDATSPAVSVRGIDRHGDFVVALAARALSDCMIARRDAKRIGVTPRREIERMPEAVLRFGDVLRHQARWRVAVVADRDRTMAAARPGIEMILHHVAVRARLRIVCEI